MEFFSDTGYCLHGRRLYEKPVLRPLAKDIDPSEWLDERLALKSSFDESTLFRPLTIDSRVSTLIAKD
jgi:hypothetical protein